MFNDKKILAVITARGGSKGIKGKNIKPLNGIPLIKYSTNACMKSKYIDKTILSTDDEKIAAVVKETGVEVPFMRPDELASDTATSLSVIQHAIKFLEDKNEKFDYIIIIQPTSPFRTSKHIDEAISKLINNKDAESIVGVTEVDYSPYWMKTIEDDRIKSFMEIDENKITRRQDLPKVYKMNGAIFISKRDVFIEKNKVLGDNILPFIMNEDESIDIDNILDFKLAELMLKEELN